MGDKLQNECNVITIFPMEIECVATNPTTPTSQDGGLSVSITGGTPPYTVIWSNGTISPAIQNLSIGEYSVTVIDYYNDFSAETTCTLVSPVDCSFSAVAINFIVEPTTTTTTTAAPTTTTTTAAPTTTTTTTAAPTTTTTTAAPTTTTTTTAAPTTTTTTTESYNALLVRNCNDELDLWAIPNNGTVNIGDYIKIKLSLYGPARPGCYEVTQLYSGYITALVHTIYTDCTCTLSP